MQDLLVIVPCGKAKVWDTRPERLAVAAQEAYTGAPFTVNIGYAKHFAQEWRVLSAKYGFLAPDQPITRYNVTFKDTRSPDRIMVAALRRQITQQGLDRFPLVVGLGGSDYRAVIAEAFAPISTQLIFPFAGLPIGMAMAAVKKAIAGGPSHEAWLRDHNRQSSAPTSGQRLDRPDKVPMSLERAADAGIPPVYHPLAAYLVAQPSDRVTCSFAQIEDPWPRAPLQCVGPCGVVGQQPSWTCLCRRLARFGLDNSRT